MNRHLYGGIRVVRQNSLWLTALLLVGLFLGISLFTDAEAVYDAILATEGWRFGVVIALTTTSYGIRFLKWDYYLRRLGYNLPLTRSLLVFTSGLMMAITPGKAGEVWKGWFLKDLEDVPISETTSIVGAERITDLLALSGFALLGITIYQQNSAVLYGVILIFLIGILILQWRSLCLCLLGQLLKFPKISKHADSIKSFYEGAYKLFKLKPLVVALAISLVAWGLEGIALWVILDGYATNSTLLLALFVFGVGSVVGAVSLLPGGLGAAEASMVGSLVLFGYAQPLAVSSTLIIRAGTLWYGAFLGTVVFVGYRLLRGRGLLRG